MVHGKPVGLLYFVTSCRMGQLYTVIWLFLLKDQIKEFPCITKLIERPRLEHKFRVCTLEFESNLVVSGIVVLIKKSFFFGLNMLVCKLYNLKPLYINQTILAAFIQGGFTGCLSY